MFLTDEQEVPPPGPVAAEAPHFSAMEPFNPLLFSQQRTTNWQSAKGRSQAVGK
jgi:hypothetical protein